MTANRDQLPDQDVAQPIQPTPRDPHTGNVWPTMARRLSSGYWHLRSTGPCNWAQPPVWPCDEITLREHAFGEASESFLSALVVVAREALNGGEA
jgi:hypothetical protein